MRYDSISSKGYTLEDKVYSYIQDKIIVLCSYKAYKINYILGVKIRIVTGLSLVGFEFSSLKPRKIH